MTLTHPRTYALKTYPRLGSVDMGVGLVQARQSPIDVTSLLHPAPPPPTTTPTATPHPHLEQQRNTCVRLRETTLDKAGEEADGIRRRN